jgi:hypothetical protein
MRAATAAGLLAATLTGCTAHTTPSVESLAGDWFGRVSTSRGHTSARLTIARDGRYEGTAYFDDGDEPLHGTIMALPSGRLRYVSSDGDGVVGLDNGTLRLRGDGGATAASFTRRP